MSTLVVDTLTGKSTATTLTIGSTPVVSASANSLTIRGEGSAQTSVQQGLAKAWAFTAADGASISDSFNISSLGDTAAGQQTLNFNNDFAVSGFAGFTAGASVSFDNDTPKTTSDIDYRTMNDSFTATDTTNLDSIISGDLA